MKVLGILTIQAPPEGHCPCCFSRQLLATVEQAAQILLARHYDQHPPKLGDYCGQTASAAVQAAERVL